jgi:hypothetical protein
MYNAILLVWRDKVLFNLVRPTTVVHAVKGETFVESYAGPFQGTQTIAGNDWQPYIRTMPHAEFPSGSSCVCTAFAETLQALSGSDETNIAVVQEIPAGSSKLEPGLTPAADFTLSFTKWSEIQELCGVSREYGGMHFSEAVPAGEQLCGGVGGLIVSRANLLKDGDASGAMGDINDVAIHVQTKTY